MQEPTFSSTRPRLCTLFMTLSLAIGTLGAETAAQATTIGRVLESIPQASTLSSLLKDSDTAKHLLYATRSTATVFVPTNAAIAKLSDQARTSLTDPGNRHWLERVLTYHIVHNRRIDRYILSEIGLVKNRASQLVPVAMDQDRSIAVGGADIVEYDIVCSNGVIHFIDEVIMPVELDIFESLEADGRFSRLCELIVRSGLTKILQDRHKTYTVLAPTDMRTPVKPIGRSWTAVPSPATSSGMIACSAATCSSPTCQPTIPMNTNTNSGSSTGANRLSSRSMGGSSTSRPGPQGRSSLPLIRPWWLTRPPSSPSPSSNQAGWWYQTAAGCPCSRS